MQFKQGLCVFTASGEDVGRIDRVVLDPHTNEVASLVVRKGFLFTDDKIIPMDLVFQASEDRVTLRPGIGDALKNLANFEETHYIPIDDATAQAYPRATYESSLYWYSREAMGAAYASSYPFPFPHDRDETYRNIPEGTIALKEGAQVISRDNKHIGNVECVFVDAETDKAVYFLISQGLFFKARKVVPTYWVRKITEDKVYLLVGSDLLDRLYDYEGSVQHSIRSK